MPSVGVASLFEYLSGRATYHAFAHVPPPVLQYAGVCNNVPTGQWIHGHAKATPEGVCVIVERAVDSDTGLMKVVVNSGGRGQLVQYQQRMSVPMAPAWISLSLNVMQQSFTATADQHMFHSTNCSDCTEYLTGYVALTSGWNMAVFDNFSIAAPPPPKPHKNSWVQTFDVSRTWTSELSIVRRELCVLCCLINPLHCVSVAYWRRIPLVF